VPEEAFSPLPQAGEGPGHHGNASVVCRSRFRPSGAAGRRSAGC
jgi:hypothetical protein